MTDLNRQEQLTTAELAGRRGNFTDSLDPEADARNAGYGEEYLAANPGRPRLVQGDRERTDFERAELRDESVRDHVTSDMPETDRDWGTTTPDINSAANHAAPETASLFSDTDIGDLRTRWNDVQAGFVDEPRRSVEQADQLVATVMQRLAEGFANERASLERQWDSGDNVSTEDLRVALQRYRAFFGRLLHAA
jgi:hypothetical protein